VAHLLPLPLLGLRQRSHSWRRLPTRAELPHGHVSATPPVFALRHDRLRPRFNRFPQLTHSTVCCRLDQRLDCLGHVHAASACMSQPPWWNPISPSTFTHQLARSRETMAVPHSRSLSLCARLVWQVLLELEHVDQF